MLSQERIITLLTVSMRGFKLPDRKERKKEKKERPRDRQLERQRRLRDRQLERKERLRDRQAKRRKIRRFHWIKSLINLIPISLKEVIQRQ